MYGASQDPHFLTVVNYLPADLQSGLWVTPTSSRRHVPPVGRAGAVVGLLGWGLLVLPHTLTSYGYAAGERAGIVVLAPDI